MSQLLAYLCPTILGILKSYSTIVIGGGPAGMAAAIFASAGPTLILERNDSLGKKLLIAGTGRCNITHHGDIGDFIHHYGDHGKFLKKALREFTNTDMVQFFTDRGLATIVDKNGKVFPHTEKSRDVLRVLLDECRARGVEIRSNQQVVRVDRVEEQFVVAANGETFGAKHLVVATGGRSYPTTGSTGDGYLLAQQLGHTVVEPRPALTPVFVKDYPFAELAGVSLDAVPVYLYRGAKKVAEHSGDIGFTHKGISGPGIIDFSRHMLPGDTLRINFVSKPVDAFRRSFIDGAATQGRQTVQTFLRDYDLPKSLMRALLDRCNLDAAECLSNVVAAKRNLLIELLCEFPFQIDRLGGFKVAMATAGGVALDEVSSKTMESKRCPNLYFAGEVLDIDGDTGGYNIQAAFSTGYVAGKAISKKVEAAQ